ncbi:MAG: glycosyltransferase family 39 protein [Proteobacteria bacterium]|nr:glycosyltransferase family 39 protein [Pseudomonadota bacterium]
MTKLKISYGIIFIILICGAAYSLYLGDDLRYLDEEHYYQIAENLSSQFSYSISGDESTAFRPPGYPILLSAFMYIGADIFHLRMLNFIFLGLCIIFLAKIIEKLYSTRAAIISSCLVLAYPVLFYTSSTLYPQIFAAFLLLAFLFQLVTKTASTWLYILMGINYAILILTIPVFLLLLPIIGIWAIYSNKDIKIKHIFALLISVSIVVGVWTVRNYLVFNSFILTSSNAGTVLLLGNSENTTPNSGTNADISKYQQQTIGMNEVDRDKYFSSQAIKFMLEDPVRTIERYTLKFINYFNYRNNIRIKSESSKAKDMLMLATYGTLLGLLIIRLLLFVRYKVSRFELLLLSLYVCSGLIYAIFFTRIRFRLPFDFLLIGMVAIFLDNVITTWQNSNSR